MIKTKNNIREDGGRKKQRITYGKTEREGYRRKKQRIT